MSQDGHQEDSFTDGSLSPMSGPMSARILSSASDARTREETIVLSNQFHSLPTRPFELDPKGVSAKQITHEINEMRNRMHSINEELNSRLDKYNLTSAGLSDRHPSITIETSSSLSHQIQMRSRLLASQEYQLAQLRKNLKIAAACEPTATNFSPLEQKIDRMRHKLVELRRERDSLQTNLKRLDKSRPKQTVDTNQSHQGRQVEATKSLVRHARKKLTALSVEERNIDLQTAELQQKNTEMDASVTRYASLAQQRGLLVRLNPKLSKFHQSYSELTNELQKIEKKALVTKKHTATLEESARQQLVVLKKQIKAIQLRTEELDKEASQIKIQETNLSPLTKVKQRPIPKIQQDSESPLGRILIPKRVESPQPQRKQRSMSYSINVAGRKPSQQLKQAFARSTLQIDDSSVHRRWEISKGLSAILDMDLNQDSEAGFLKPLKSPVLPKVKK